MNIQQNNGHNKLMEWANKANNLVDRCRWIECQPEGSTNNQKRSTEATKVVVAKQVGNERLKQAREQVTELNQAWNWFTTKVQTMNEQRPQLTPDQAEEMEILDEWFRAVETSIEDNCGQIIFEYENDRYDRSNEKKNNSI